jgi:hypothetical protein
VANKPVYRTLGSLDQYSDEFCESLIRRMARKVGVGSRVVNTIAALLLACAWAAGGFVLAWAVCRAPLAGVGAQVIPWFVAAMAGAAGFVVSYRNLARATVLSWLRLAVAPRIIDGGRCLFCGYSLEGLPGKDHLVVCPECGRTVPIGLGALDQVEQMILRGELPVEGRFAEGLRGGPAPNRAPGGGE